jgi:hypothetical protein
MDSRQLERAIDLGKRVEHLFVALVGDGGFPYVNSARRIEQVAANQFALEEWFCPLTVQHLSENPRLAVLIWDPATDDGYEILGEALMFESGAYLNGFLPGLEEGADFSQVNRKLIIRAEKISPFSHALRCDDIRQMAESGDRMNRHDAGDDGRAVPLCQFAPEWAEHARFDRGDEPCDDGRAGTV